MATVTLDRTTKTLAIALSTMEFAVLDELITQEGPSRIEIAIAYLASTIAHAKTEQQKASLIEYIQTAPDATRAELEAVRTTTVNVES